MTDPQAPAIPPDAPQDVKDFFDCKGDKLVWKKGTVTWLGLPINPDVSFDHGNTPGSININVTVGMPPLGKTFSLPASVNPAGELTVDTSNLPDLTDIGLGGPKDVDAAIKRINDWFKKNGKKLKGAKLKGGEVTLEKIAFGAAPPAAVPVAPGGGAKPVPVTPAPPKAAPAPGGGSGPPAGGLCSMMFLLVLGVIVLGGAIGFGVVYFAPTDEGQVAQATATGTPPPTFAPSPTPEPSATQAPPPTQTPSATQTPTATQTPNASPSPTSSPPATATDGSAGAITGFCVRVVHQELEGFLSYLDWFIYWAGADVELFVVTVAGANDGEPVELVFDPVTGSWHGALGLRQAGDKQVTKVEAVLSDGSVVDVTGELVDEFGFEEFTVRFPQEDSFGDCPD